MKVKNCFNLILTLVIILFVSCDKSNDIKENLEFNFQRVGGWIVLNENMKITVGFASYSISYREIDTMEPKSYSRIISTPDELWSHLTSTFNLKTFTKIKDGSCRACVDGYDETFSVSIDDKTYSIYNGDADENFKQMLDFFDPIFEQVENFEIMVGFRE